MPDERLRAGVAMLAMAAAPRRAGTIAPAQVAPAPRPSLNLYGVTGLIDMPSAESAAGRAGLGELQPVRQYAAAQFQLPAAAAAVGDAAVFDDQRLRAGSRTGRSTRATTCSIAASTCSSAAQGANGAWLPAVALGFRDVLGTGVYSGEYLVATKTVARDFTLTGGIGWGRLASVGGVANPFCSASDSFCTRENDFGNGGKPTFDAMFHGEKMGFFGGVEWRTPIDKLTLKAEISSDAYTREQQGPERASSVKSPVNVGVEYRPRDGITLGGYYMYGSDGRVQRRDQRQPAAPAGAA